MLNKFTSAPVSMRAERGMVCPSSNSSFKPMTDWVGLMEGLLVGLSKDMERGLMSLCGESSAAKYVGWGANDTLSEKLSFLLVF